MPCLVEELLHVEHVLLGRLEHRVEPAQDGHRQDHVAVFAAHVEVAKDVVGDAPDEARDAVELSGGGRRFRDSQGCREPSFSLTGRSSTRPRL